MPTPPISDQLCIEAVELVEKYGSVGLAARKEGIAHSTLRHRVKMAQQRGIGTINQQLNTLHGNNPEYDLNHVVPAPLIIRGTSTLYDQDGTLKQQWVKTKLEDQLVEVAMKAAIEALASEIPRAKPVAKPNHISAHLCNLYPFTDCHVGQKSWGAETGDDWDLEISEETLKGAFDYLIQASPPAATCIVAQLGDFLHFDSLSAVTPTNGYLLDADSRFSKVVKVAIRILRYIVDSALRKHENVIVLMAEGNHDIASSVWLRHLFAMLYENEPRVQVIDSERPYYAYQHGQTMLSFHHGHLAKNESLPAIFAAMFPKMWGDTTHRYAHSGHMHHSHEKEHRGMIVKQHRTIAAPDAHSARHGYISERGIEAETYHSVFGKAGSIVVTPEMMK